MDVNIIRGEAILTGGPIDYIATLSVGDTALVDGGIYYFQINANNTTVAPTINVNGIGAKVIIRNNGDDIRINELQIDTWIEVIYNLLYDSFFLLGGPVAYQGVDTNAINAGGGTITLVPGAELPIQLITGNDTLAADWTFDFGGSPKDGDVFVFDYRATMVLNGHNITIGGLALSDAQALAGNGWIESYYDADSASWKSKFILTGTAGSNLRTTKTFADATARGLDVPDFIGQFGEQIDTRTTYQAYGLSAGNWKLPANTQVQSDTYAVASGTNTYSITLSPALLAYAAGNSFNVLFTNGNTGASTININTLGAKAIKKNGAIALASGDIIAGKIYIVIYDGTNFQLGVQTNANDLWEVGIGIGSLETKLPGSDASGDNSIAVGKNAICNDTDDIAIGNGANSSGTGSTAIGTGASANGGGSHAHGDGAQANANFSNAIGSVATTNIENSTNISGVIITRKDDGTIFTDETRFGAGSLVTIMTAEMDLKTTTDYQIDIPSGALFYPDEVDLILTTIGGTVTAQPFIRAGKNGTLAFYLAIVQTTALTATLGNRERQATLLTNAGSSTITASITTAATGSSTIKGRFVFRGILMENQ